MKTNNLQILMPVHNEANNIEKQISKIVKILKKKIRFEFLICEDGSNDGTSEVLKKLQKKFKIKVLSKKKKTRLLYSSNVRNQKSIWRLPFNYGL